MKQNRFSVAILAAAVTLATTGCYDNRYHEPVRLVPQQQMAQQCGQSVQTGNIECIALPIGSVNPYQYPAPQQYYQDHGIGMGTVLGAAALGAGAGYLAGRGNNTGTTQSYQQQQAPAYNNSYAPNTRSSSYAQQPTAAPTQGQAFRPQTAANTATAKPLTMIQSTPLASAAPARPAYTPPSPPARPAFAPAPARPAFTPSPARSFTPTAARSSSSSSTSRSSFSPTAAHRK